MFLLLFYKNKVLWLSRTRRGEGSFFCK